MLRTIRVYGPLARFLKRRVFRAEVKTPAEAVRFLIANFPGVEKHISEYDYQVKINNLALDIGINPDYLYLESDKSQDISIIPVIAGAGGAGGKILAGIGLIAASILLAPVGGGFLGLGAGLAHTAGGAVATGFVSAGISSAIGAIGASLVLGGVAQLLTPAAQELKSTGADSASDPRKSYSFSGVQNTSRQGTPVPVIYGETIVGSIVISAGISTEKVTT